MVTVSISSFLVLGGYGFVDRKKTAELFRLSFLFKPNREWAFTRELRIFTRVRASTNEFRAFTREFRIKLLSC
ncbi:hypothetical protein [Peribacillus sp. NPDC058075]|uniref:hypothetical protein n=1 Tax=unclassified Peribacillus TaxID=2675266 RepID=UPI0036DACA46